MEMSNFNGLMAVIAGLRSSSVNRLKKTWAVNSILIFLQFFFFSSSCLIIWRTANSAISTVAVEQARENL
jgi:hypothetical protein